MTLTFNSL